MRCHVSRCGALFLLLWFICTIIYIKTVLFFRHNARPWIISRFIRGELHAKWSLNQKSTRSRATEKLTWLFWKQIFAFSKQCNTTINILNKEMLQFRDYLSVIALKIGNLCLQHCCNKFQNITIKCEYRVQYLYETSFGI